MTPTERATPVASTVRCVPSQNVPEPLWPDLSNHSKAWFLAKQELGPHALTQEIAYRAEIIRRQLESQ